MIKTIPLAMLMSLSVLSGCTHQLAIKNMDMYQNVSLNSLRQPTSLGIKADVKTAEGKKFVKAVADSLGKYNVHATTAIMNGHGDVDAIATITVNSEYKGSGWNFLINWPGFLIFTPAWHGYNYEINHDFMVLITDGNTGEKINSFAVPVSLDIRHASFNRTWTEIGWLEFGIIPLIGGFVFINYDDNVTPIAHEKAAPIIADYIAQEIVENLIAVAGGKKAKSIASEQASTPPPLASASKTE
ncbi:hypothetical protein [Pontiella sulfatireligans]|uniref:DUF4136 domain-containing protein n=1 Tax=Pontiella sulfatireligans TaxID=2750658 RepID=A0A6C2UEV7_9BACT|nr:hypothetical protein [Pontiella sulfatireligans]VGO18067.1 hypothetical protein SCARR_00118 [Pontiella sulfatireligans]